MGWSGLSEFWKNNNNNNPQLQNANEKCMCYTPLTLKFLDSEFSEKQYSQSSVGGSWVMTITGGKTCAQESEAIYIKKELSPTLNSLGQRKKNS